MRSPGHSHLELVPAIPYLGPMVPPAGAPAARDSDERSGEVAVISHELRNSLAVIRNAARLLRPAQSGCTLSTARMLIERHVGHMSRHIDELPDPRRRITGHELNCSRIDLRAIVRHAAAAIRPEMTRRRHRFVIKLPEQAVWAHADGARLEQVFSNLLINAAKYTPDGGNIALSMEPDDGGVRVRIVDSGVGIEPVMLPRVFGMFVQVESSLPASEGGCGIGLAVVRTLVEQHGGTVTARSAGLGLGSEFAVVLPTLKA